MRLAAEWEAFRAAPHEYVCDGSTVVAIGDYSGTNKATGKPFEAPFAHVWKLREGAVVGFQQFTDTAVCSGPCDERGRSAGPRHDLRKQIEPDPRSPIQLAIMPIVIAPGRLSEWIEAKAHLPYFSEDALRRIGP